MHPNCATGDGDRGPVGRYAQPMPKHNVVIHDPEVIGFTESSVSLSFSLRAGDSPHDAPAEVVLRSEGGDTIRCGSEACAGSHLVRVEGLSAKTPYQIEIVAEDAEPPEPGRHFSGEITTLPAPSGQLAAQFASMNDLHFGEMRIGGQLTEDHEYGPAAPGFPVVDGTLTETPYATFMNQDAVAEINTLGVDLAIIKGDIADGGLPEQFETAAKTFAGFQVPHHVLLGNHDYLARNHDLEVDGYALLSQEPAPKIIEVAGWRLVMLETAKPGKHDGVFGEARRDWLADTLADSRQSNTPTLLIMHHQPVPPEHRDSYPNSIGLDSSDSLAFFDLIGDCPQVRAVLIGHTHRNCIRTYPASGPTPFIETHNSKDFPGGYAHYRLFDDGSFRQEVRRTGSLRALEHSELCRALFRGAYPGFTMGSLTERSLAIGPTPSVR